MTMQKLTMEYEQMPPTQVATTSPATFIDTLNNIAKGVFGDFPPELSQLLSKSGLYLMIATTDGSSIRSVVYENGSFKENADQFGSDVLYSYSPNLKNVVFFVIPAEKKANDTRNWEEKKADYSNALWTEQATLFSTTIGSTTPTIADALGQAITVGTPVIEYKELPVISNSGEMLFVGWDKSYVPSIENAESWSIYKMVEGEPVFMVHGFNPVWTSDGNVLYLKNDGIYETDAQFSSSTKIASTDSSQKGHSDERIALSSDMIHLAWMRPEQSKVLSFSKNTAGLFEKQNEYSAVGFQILFSPDNRYLALQTQVGHAAQAGESLSSKIEFFNLFSSSSAPEGEVILDMFGHLPIRLVNWITSFNP